MSTPTKGIAFKETPEQKTSRLLQESKILLEEITKARKELANIAAIRKAESENSDPDEILSLKIPGGKKSRRQKRSKKNKSARQRRHQ